eukprot:scaffold90949_cov60-Phaeocystis_antarctica.AAC.3
MARDEAIHLLEDRHAQGIVVVAEHDAAWAQEEVVQMQLYVRTASFVGRVDIHDVDLPPHEPEDSRCLN